MKNYLSTKEYSYLGDLDYYVKTDKTMPQWTLYEFFDGVTKLLIYAPRFKAVKPVISCLQDGQVLQEEQYPDWVSNYVHAFLVKYKRTRE
ncbi:hypothetical protein ACT91Q_07290 [Brevibacillus thermoruber]|jgi:hypothetical protein|uniref:hypothetical protein n=1 Tax=Brevibacillus thermoruber TaxID=33942 RepID=UPI004041A140